MCSFITYKKAMKNWSFSNPCWGSSTLPQTPATKWGSLSRPSLTQSSRRTSTSCTQPAPSSTTYSSIRRLKKWTSRSGWRRLLISILPTIETSSTTMQEFRSQITRTHQECTPRYCHLRWCSILKTSTSFKSGRTWKPACSRLGHPEARSYTRVYGTWAWRAG